MWKIASRRAAEEVLEGCRGKVEAMGGLRAWRGRERESAGGRSSWGWDEEGKKGREEEGEGEGEEEGEEKYREKEAEEEEEVSFCAPLFFSLSPRSVGGLGVQKISEIRYADNNIGVFFSSSRTSQWQ